MVKRILVTLGVLFILLLVCAGAAWTVATGRLHDTMDDVAAHDLAIPTDSAAVANGNRLATAYGCRDCHGEDLGGQVMIEDAAFMVIHAPNLTSGEGGTSAYTPTDWDRALRHGIARNGRTLIIMPSASYAKVTDQDLGEVVAYLRSLPPIDRPAPPASFGPASRIAALAAHGEIVPAVAIDHEASHVPAVPREPSAAYGRYLAEAGCTGCHGSDFSGLPPGPGGELPSANLTRSVQFGLGAWSFEDFDRAVRSGRRPDGGGIDPMMPWASLSALTYDEVLALWRYLETVPAVDVDRRAAAR